MDFTYKQIAREGQAAAECTGDYKAAALARLATLERDYLPSGSGFDCGSRIIDASEQKIIIKASYHARWTKADSVALAIYASELALPIYEAKYPDDDRPRKAIDAAKKWLAEPTEENRTAALAAANAAARAAFAAANAAYAANAARAAARTAYAAGRAAVCTAYAAHAAYTAANADTTDKINAWIIAHIDDLEEIKSS